jgi:hypothetical protein
MSVVLLRHRTGSGMFVAAVLGFVTPARGEPAKVPPWRLEYERAPGAEHCPDKKELRLSVAARIGYDPFDDAAPRTISVTVVNAPKQLEALIEARDEHGQIVATPKAWAPSSRCDHLIENAAVFLVDIVDPVTIPQPMAAPAPATTAPATSDPSSPPLPPAPRAQPPTPVPVAHREQAAQTRPSPGRSPWLLQLMLSIAAGVAFKSAPELAPSFTLGAGLRWTLFSASFEGRYDLPGRDGTRAASQLGLALLPCVHPRLYGARLLLEACVSGQITHLWLEADVTNEARFTDVAFGVGLRGGLEMRLGPVRARLGVDAIHYDRAAIIRLDGTEIWKMSAVTVAVRGGVVGVFDVF